MQSCMAMNVARGAGLTSTQLHNAFGIDQSIDLTTFNALGDAMQSPGGIGLSILKVLSPSPNCSVDILASRDVLQHS